MFVGGGTARCQSAPCKRTGTRSGAGQRAQAAAVGSSRTDLLDTPQSRNYLGQVEYSQQIREDCRAGRAVRGRRRARMRRRNPRGRIGRPNSRGCTSPQGRVDEPGRRIRAGRRAIPLLGGTDGFSDGAGSGEKRRRKLIGGCSGWMVKAPRTRSVSTEA